MAGLISQNHSIIADWIAPGSRVLDLGCGDGRLLERLQAERQSSGIGVEIDEGLVVKCLSKGLCVYQGDLGRELTGFDERSFDYVILNSTLQSVVKPCQVLNEMLRVASSAIVSISNFGYARNRLRVASSGRISRVTRLGAAWYDTPAIRYVSLSEFQQTLNAMGIEIADARYILPGGLTTARPPRLANLLVKEAIFSLRLKP
jgi:methionine biosynthesis protein MetW